MLFWREGSQYSEGSKGSEKLIDHLLCQLKEEDTPVECRCDHKPVNCRFFTSGLSVPDKRLIHSA